MEDHAGRVEDTAELGGAKSPQPRLDELLAIRVSAGFALTLCRDLLPNRIRDLGAAIGADELGVRRLVEQRPYSRQGVSPLNPLIPYPKHAPIEIRLAGSKKGVITIASRFPPWKSWNRKMMTTAPTQISRRLTLASKKNLGLRLRKMASMMFQPSRPGVGRSWKAKIDRVRERVAYMA